MVSLNKGVVSTEEFVSRTFPGPASAEAALRVALDRQAYVDLSAHAKDSPDAEICGVLVGRGCKDEKGIYVHVEACIRGTAAQEGSTHVTFTHETWRLIHQTIERDYPKLVIVGWYHTHPGFGVEFSEMDLFIHQNFFSGQHQIAILMDPLGGALALCANIEGRPSYVSRFWVDGREQTCWSPTPKSKTNAPDTSEFLESLRAVERRLSQIATSVDEQRASTHRMLLSATVFFCLGMITFAAYPIYTQFSKRLEPPKLNSHVPVPVRLGNRDVLLGVDVTEWQIPEELDALLVERAKQEAAARMARGTDAAAEAAPSTGSAKRTSSVEDSR